MLWTTLEKEIGALSVEALPGAIGELAKLRAIAEARLLAPGAGREREEGDRLVDVREAARALGTTVNTLYTRHEEEPYSRLVVREGRRLLFSWHAIQDYLEKRRR